MRVLIGGSNSTRVSPGDLSRERARSDAISGKC